MRYNHACKLEEQLKAEVDELLRQAEAADQADLPDGMNIPEELSRRAERLKAIAEAKAEIERHVSQQTNDKRELEPAVANLVALPEALGTVRCGHY